MDRLSDTMKDMNLNQMTGGAKSGSQNSSGQSQNSGPVGSPTEAQGAVGGVGVSVPSTSGAAMGGAAGGSNLATSMFSDIFPFLQGYISEESALACRSVCKEWKGPVDQALSGAGGDGPNQPSKSSGSSTSTNK